MRITRTVCVLALLLALGATSARAQKPIVDQNPVTEAFTGFAGLGFSPSPAAGQLDSDEFAGTGMSDGDLPFGGTATVGDWARGPAAAPVVTGGLYASTVGSGAPWLFVQPTAGDFNPGTLTVRYVNLNPNPITTLDVSYNIRVFNDEGRSTSWNFSYSIDNVSYTPVPALNFASPALPDPVPLWVLVARATTITGLNVPQGAFLYLRFTSADVAGAGNRDEIGVDDIVVAATNLPVELLSLAVE
jgi:hypothetical protein